MRVRWTAPAAQDLYKITQHIRRDNPTAALEVAKALYDRCESLVNMPIAAEKAASPPRASSCLPTCPISPCIAFAVTHGAQDWR